MKGGNAADLARHHGLAVGVNLDALPEKRFRVNNGTPRPITVHDSFIENHFDHLVRFLAQVLRAGEWAKTNLAGVYDSLQKETGASLEGLKTAYKNDFHRTLTPDLSDERVALFRQQKDIPADVRHSRSRFRLRRVDRPPSARSCVEAARAQRGAQGRLIHQF